MALLHKDRNNSFCFPIRACVVLKPFYTILQNYRLALSIAWQSMILQDVGVLQDKNLRCALPCYAAVHRGYFTHFNLLTMFTSLFNRLLATVFVCNLLLQGCGSSFQANSEDFVLKKSSKTDDDGQFTHPDVQPSVLSDAPHSRLPTVASAIFPSMTASTDQVASLIHHLAVGSDTVSSRAQASSTESEETDMKPAAQAAEYSSVGCLAPSCALRFLAPNMVFGAKEWAQYFGEVGENPCLPADIDEILHSACPFWPEKTVKYTHLLVLIPATVDGKPFSLNLLRKLIQRPKGGGLSTKYRSYLEEIKGEFGAQSPIHPYWVLMTRNVLKGSRGKKYAAQQALVVHHASRAGLPYKLPGALEAATVILSHYVRSGKRLYADDPWTYTRCQELIDNQYPVTIGGLSSGGLDVRFDSSSFYSSGHGVSGLRKFLETESTPICSHVEELPKLYAGMEHQRVTYDRQIEKIYEESAEILRQQAGVLLLNRNTSRAGEHTRLEVPQGKLKREYEEQLAPAEQEQASFKEEYEKLLPQRKEAQKLKGGVTPPFGEKAWAQYFGKVGAEPSLPSDIDEILNSACPFWPEKTVKDTHLLVLIPSRVAGKPFSLNLLRALIQHPQGGGRSAEYRFYSEGIKEALGTRSPVHSYWVLMTRDVLEGSRERTYASRKALVAAHAKRTGLPYELPGALEAATVILSHYVRSGERLYADDPSTSTRCQELIAWNGSNHPAAVGSFSSGGLVVSYGSYDGNRRSSDSGVASIRKFLEPDTILAGAFGVRAWKKYLGEVGAGPSLPSDIADILNSACPFWPEKTVKDTHLLVLIPSRVTGKPFSLNLLRELVQHPQGGGHSTKYRFYDSDVQEQFGAQSPVHSYWVLVTRDVLEDSRNEDYASQQALVAQHASRTGLPYELPGALEAATAILSHYVRSGEHLYTDDPWTYTRCQELVVDEDEDEYPVVVGGFSPGGLFVSAGYSRNDLSSSGVASLRKF